VPPKSAAEDMERMRRILALTRQEDQQGGEVHG
jgi:hypothetical protein